MPNRIHIDLTNSKLGPGWNTVEVEGEWPNDWDNDRIRAEAAKHYGVPTSQVSDVWPTRSTTEREIERLARQALSAGTSESDLHTALQRGIDDWYEARYLATAE